MKADKFYEITEELIDECLEIMKAKGLAYSGTENSFANFQRIGDNLSVSQFQVWFVFFSKHLDSLSSWVRGEYSDSEPIGGRIKDLICYLFLLYGMIEEANEIDCDKIASSEGTWVECRKKEDEEHE